MSRTRLISIIPLASCLALAGLAGSALAAGDPCNPRIPYTIPDLDQVRIGLPGGGSQYCVPTCTMNIFKYLTNHGYPQLQPGSGPWVGTPFIFQEMSTAISDLGVYMNTDPSGGTGGSNALAGINQWVEDSGLEGDIVTTLFALSSTDAPELGDIALSMLINRPISLSVGWYGVTAGGLVRNGGHCVAAARLPDFCTPNRKLSIRDPGNGGSANDQQPGTTETYSISTQNFTIIRSSAPDYAGPVERILSYGSSGTIAIIDGFRSFAPAFGIAACNNPVNGVCVQVFNPNPSITSGPAVSPFNIPGQSLLDIDIHPSNMRTLALTDPPTGPSTLWRIDNLPGSVPVAIPLPMDVANICTGPSWNSIYARARSGMALILISAGTPVLASQPQPINAICFDAGTNELVGLSAAARRVIRFDPETLAQRSNLPLPAGVVLGSSPSISICPRSGLLWIASATPTIYAIQRGGPGTLTLSSANTYNPALPSVGIDCNDQGHVFTSVAGAIVEFAPTSTGAWQSVRNGRFASMTAPGGVFKIARSRSNLDRRVHDSPEWTLGVLPTIFAPGVPDCKADFNLSGAVSVQDIFDFLQGWFAGDVTADFNESLNVSVQDIFDFLEAWFQGC